MQYSSNLQKNIESALVILNNMIENAIKQGMVNLNMFYTLRDGLEELKFKVENGQALDENFKKKWDSVMGWVSRTFEGTLLLSIIYKIDKEVISIGLNS